MEYLVLVALEKTWDGRGISSVKGLEGSVLTDNIFFYLYCIKTRLPGKMCHE
jgi:hypothetical protein